MMRRCEGVVLVMAMLGGCETAHPSGEPDVELESGTGAEDESSTGTEVVDEDTGSAGEGSDGDGTGGTDDGDDGDSSTGEPQEEPPCTRPSAPSLTVEVLPVQQTDPDILAGPSHVWVEPEGEPADRLFVFLPGTGGPAGVYRHVLRNAAAGGYHALGLSYRNEVAVNDLCSLPDSGCHDDVRYEVITGEDRSPLVDIPRVDSIEHRLVSALQFLGWTEYLEGDQPAWERIAFAGHSQGAGHAAHIAKRHLVHRAVLFAGVEPADWTEPEGLTPVDRLFAFIHTEDDQYTGIVAAWEKLGVPGALVDRDVVAPDYGGSHQLLTSVPAPGDNPHGSVVTDIYTPMDGEQPLYAETWCYLVGP